ncbi:MAG: hypothetical protein WBV94_14965 [Blastocatellia bacterium]
MLFFFLILLGIHGSSTGVTAGWWAPEKAYSGYLFNVVSPPGQGSYRIDESTLQSLLMGEAKIIRWDELTVATPYSLSQLSHTPRFPVVNTNIGNGQNMLLTPHVPVWHVVTLARPATWGYFILGAQRGLAWYWWFPMFACFTVLYLLFEVLFQGHKGIAAFGAFWFCASAYVVCWSLWPAYLTFFIALAVLAFYKLLVSDKHLVQALCALMIGLSLPGFVMFLYPAWQVPMAYFFGVVLVCLFIRDKLYHAFKPFDIRKALYLVAGLLIAGALTYSFVRTCAPDFKAIADTVYPGRRVSVGGDHSFGQLFKGFYNIITIYTSPQGLKNESEASSFYYFFPAVFFAVLISRRLARQLGIVGWSMIAYIVAMLFFLLVGVPQFVARLTLWSYVPGYRADLTLGLASIILSLHTLIVIKRSQATDENRLQTFVPFLVGGLVVVLLIWNSLFLMKQATRFASPPFILFISFLAGLISYFLLAGRARAFLILTGALVFATTAQFNPLATNLDHIYDSELAQAITRINNRSTDRPFWVCYGGTHSGALITILAGKSLSGIQFPPQMDIWHTLDPNRRFEKVYNQYAEVIFEYTSDDNKVYFDSTQNGSFTVQVSPYNPLLKSLGVRYVLLMDDAQKVVDTSRLSLIHRSSTGNFFIYEIP